MRAHLIWMLLLGACASAPAAPELTASWDRDGALEVSGLAPTLVAWARHEAQARGAREVVIVADPRADAASGHWGVSALLRLERGALLVSGGRIALRGAIRHTRERADLERELGPLPDVVVDGTRLLPDEGRVTGPGAYTLRTLEGAPAEVDEAGRTRAGRYLDPRGALVVVPPGRTTRVVVDAPTITVGGQRVALDEDMRVVGMTDPDGFDALPRPRAKTVESMPWFAYKRSTTSCTHPAADVSLVVLSASGTLDAAEAIQDQLTRGLAEHFIIDFDGTIHQLADPAKALQMGLDRLDDRTIGVELVGRFSNLLRKPDVRWDAPGDPRHEALVRHPRSPTAEGVYREVTVKTWSLTDAQRRALASLVRALGRIYPKLDGPMRSADGTVSHDYIGDLGDLRGIVARYHVDKSRLDLGPAIDWEALAPEWR